jgi:diguanylate cyclase (GGDEF)-like protein/PAS domain S-box-containing protein
VFAVFLAILSGLAILGNNLQSSVRAYVGGEGLWSKAQKDAVFDLARYLSSGDEQAFGDFQKHLSVPLGDRRAREELEKARPNLREAAEGFQAGRNHAGDVEGMIRLFRNFRWLPEMERAIAIWTQGDALIVELRQLAERVHARLSAGPVDDRQRAEMAAELQRLNTRLTVLEDDFSATLGVAARRVRSLLVAAIVGIGLTLGLAGAFVALRVAQLLGRREIELRDSERRHRELFERSPAGLYRTNLDGRLLTCNTALARLLGYQSKEDVLHLSLGELFADAEERRGLLDRLHAGDALINRAVRLKRRDGSSVWALLSESLLPDAGDRSVMEGSLIDITDRKQAEEINEHRATHDSLTDLPNRALFADRLEVAIHQARRRGQRIAVMFLDLDGFKTVNDTRGHAAGDQILIESAQRLKSCLRAEDTVARLGGDEFILLLTGGISHESHVATMAHKILGSFERPFTIQGHELRMSASIGISLFPEDGDDPTTLVSRADAALYRAKDAGGNTFKYSAPARPATDGVGPGVSG